MSFEMTEDDLISIDDDQHPVSHRVYAACWRLCAGGVRPFTPSRQLRSTQNVRQLGEQLEAIEMFVDAVLAYGEMDKLERQFNVLRKIVAGRMSVDQFSSHVSSLDTSRRCNAVWESQSTAYRCRTCAKNTTMAICVACYKAGPHHEDGHDFNRFLSNAGGACDCGDKGVMDEKGFCPRHGNRKDTETDDKILSEKKLRAACVAVFVLSKMIVAVLRYLRRNFRVLAASRDATAMSSGLSTLWAAVAPAIEFLHEYTSSGGPLTACLAGIFMDKDLYQWAHLARENNDEMTSDTNNGSDRAFSDAEKLSTDLHSEDRSGESATSHALSTRHCSVERDERIWLDEVSLIGFDQARESLGYPSSESPAVSPQYDSLLAELCFWLARMAFPQRLVTFMLSMLPIDEYRDSFARHYFLHYWHGAKVLLLAAAPNGEDEMDELAQAGRDSLTAEAVTNRWVHVSVQLLSAADMCLRLRTEMHLPMHDIVLGALFHVAKQFLRAGKLRCKEISAQEEDEDMPSTSPAMLTFNCAPPGAFVYSKYWAIASDLANLLGHGEEARTALESDRVFDMWLQLVQWAQGADGQRRLWAGDARLRDERAYHIAFSIEAELVGRIALCLYDALVHVDLAQSETAKSCEHMDTAKTAVIEQPQSDGGVSEPMDKCSTPPDSTEMAETKNPHSPREHSDVLCVRWVDKCVQALRKWLIDLGMAKFDPKCLATQMSRLWLSFHLPMHRNLSTALACAARRGLCAPNADDAQHLFQMALMHPLQVQVCRTEVALGMWVRNGNGMKYRNWFYAHPNFSTTMLDADLFFIRVCASVLPPDWFLCTLFERFWLCEYFATEPGPPSQPTSEADQTPPTECSFAVVCTKDGVRSEWIGGLLEAALKLLSIVLAADFVDPCLPLAERLTSELVTALAVKDSTHSAVIKNVPQRTPFEAVQIERLVDGALQEVTAFRAPTVSGTMSQGLYSLKTEVWRDIFDPLLAHTRAVYSRDYADSMQRYAQAVSAFTRGASGALWPPYRMPSAQMLARNERVALVLNSRTLHAALFVLLYNRWRCGPTAVNDETLALVVHLVSAALYANCCKKQSGIYHDNLDALQLSLDGSHDTAKLAAAGSRNELSWLGGVFISDSAHVNFSTRLHFEQNTAPCSLRCNQSILSLLLRIYTLAAREAGLPDAQHIWTNRYDVNDGADGVLKSALSHGGPLQFIDRALTFASACHVCCRWELQRAEFEIRPPPAMTAISQVGGAKASGSAADASTHSTQMDTDAAVELDPAKKALDRKTVARIRQERVMARFAAQQQRALRRLEASEGSTSRLSESSNVAGNLPTGTTANADVAAGDQDDQCVICNEHAARVCDRIPALVASVQVCNVPSWQWASSVARVNPIKMNVSTQCGDSIISGTVRFCAAGAARRKALHALADKAPDGSAWQRTSLDWQECCVHVATCGHLVHMDCFHSYLQSLLETDRRWGTAAGGGNQPAHSPRLGEFSCPLCRRVSNATLPLCPRPRLGGAGQCCAALHNEPPDAAMEGAADGEQERRLCARTAFALPATLKSGRVDALVASCVQRALDSLDLNAASVMDALRPATDLSGQVDRVLTVCNRMVPPARPPPADDSPGPAALPTVGTHHPQFVLAIIRWNLEYESASLCYGDMRTRDLRQSALHPDRGALLWSLGAQYAMTERQRLHSNHGHIGTVWNLLSPDCERNTLSTSCDEAGGSTGACLFADVTDLLVSLCMCLLLALPDDVLLRQSALRCIYGRLLYVRLLQSVLRAFLLAKANGWADALAKDIADIRRIDNVDHTGILRAYLACAKSWGDAVTAGDVTQIRATAAVPDSGWTATADSMDALLAQVKADCVPFQRVAILLANYTLGSRKVITDLAVMDNFDAAHAFLTDDCADPLLSDWPVGKREVDLNRAKVWLAGAKLLTTDDMSSLAPCLLWPWVFDGARLIELPTSYDDLFDVYTTSKCPTCGTVPAQPIVCLICARPLCHGSTAQRCGCTRVTLTGGAATERSEVEAHVDVCGAGLGVLLDVRSTQVTITRSGLRGYVWGSPYLDAHGEEDKDLSRGRPLLLSADRYNLLNQQWRKAAVGAPSAPWRWMTSSLRLHNQGALIE